ncbi:lysine transporter LysE [Acinetobacter sp. ANC 4558]|uniref:LysE family translocator n=1 Tax=Acinetobacter sp. ANC 4558 TaxID=1977876 RepID=UPI000A353FD8|nr:LysE family translocator [Acinetobacter sp. ANC 4558]OTG88163.1 lysine transporter LysE [Acinetobacter sp. ANC 4558]
MELKIQMITYIFTLAFAAFIPGPGMIGIMLKTISQGKRNGWMMLFGLITGDIIYLSISIFMMTTITQINSRFTFYLTIGSSIYLLYLAYKFWIIKENLLEYSLKINASFSSYRDGLLLTLSNPKTISFYFALVPTIFGSQSLPHLSIFLLLMTIMTLMFVGSGYIIFSSQLKVKLTSVRIQQILLKILSSIMGLLALSMLYSEINIG